MSSTPSADNTTRERNSSLQHAESSDYRGSVNTPSRPISPTPKTPAAPEERKPRMIINKMVLENFKSCYGKVEVGQFHKSFSTIVGPNGSGKSNIIDALLFVFGYRANKMRISKLSELIHSSEGRENLDACAVEIYFEEIIDLPGSDNFEIIPHSQLVISRQAYRNNTSKYFINGRQSNYTEVTNLLKEKGVDLGHKRFLILQGEIESIAPMKPKAPNEHEDGLLEYLEDIIGTFKYKVPIEEADKKINVLNKERSKKLNQLKSMEKKRKSLEAEKKEVEDYLRVQNSIALTKSALYQKQLLECTNVIEIHNRAVNQLKDKLREEEEKRAQTQLDHKDLEDKYRESFKNYQELEEATNGILKELADHKEEERHLRGLKKRATANQKKTTEKISNDRHEISKEKTVVRFNERELIDLMEELPNLKRTFEIEDNKLMPILKSLNCETKVYTEQIEEKSRELLLWSEKINTMRSTINNDQIEYNYLRERVDLRKKELKESEEGIVTSQKMCRAKEQEILFTKERIHIINQEIQQINTKLLNYLNQKENKETELKNTRQRANVARRIFTSYQTRNEALNFLTKLSNEGHLEGFHGRLGNLCVIDQKFDVAITNACSSLNNFVVESLDIADKCVEHVTKNNLGRIKVMIMEKEKYDFNMGPVQTPENVPRLFDLVKPKEERYAPLFFDVMKNTLVVNDFKQATRIAYGGECKWSVVTLNGELINANGIINSGGSSDVTPETVRQLGQELNHLEKQWKEFEDELKSLQSQLQEKEGVVLNLENYLSTLEEEFNSSKSHVIDTEKRISELRQENKLNADEVRRMEQLRTQIDALTQDLSKLKSHTSKINEEVASLQSKIDEIAREKFEPQKSKVDQIREQITIISERISKSQMDKTEAEYNITEFESNITNNERNLEELNNEIEQLTEEIQQKVEAICSIRDRSNEATSILKDKKDELDEIKGECDKMTKLIFEMKLFQLEIEIELDTKEGVLEETNQKEGQLRNSFNKLTLNIIGEDDEQDKFLNFTDDELNAMNIKTLQEEIDVLILKGIQYM